MAFKLILNKGEKLYREKWNKSTVTAVDSEQHAIEGAKGSPLPSIAEAFEELSNLINSGRSVDLRLKPFCDACSLVSILFGCLGIAFKFAELEYVSKVRDLSEASQRYGTLKIILDVDIKNETVRTQGSLSRNLRRVRQGLDLIRALFENFLSPEYGSLKEAASTAYSQVCAPYHTWAVRTAVSAGMCALPTREQLILKLNETREFLITSYIQLYGFYRPLFHWKLIDEYILATIPQYLVLKFSVEFY